MQEWHKTLSAYWSAYLNRPLTLRFLSRKDSE